MIFLISLPIVSCGQKTTSNKTENTLKSFDPIDSNDFSIINFKALSKDYAYSDRAYLIDKISPETNYSYWEFVYKDALTDNYRGRIIVYNGDRLKYSSIAKKVDSTQGFFEECHPGICFSYIVGIKSDMTIDLIDSNARLKQFIGHIDNIEEVILMAKIYDYWFDTDTIIGGAYRERRNDYLLYLMDYSSTPVTYKSVKAILTKNGDFKIIDKTIYKQEDEYIIE